MTERISQLVDQELSPEQQEALFSQIVISRKATQTWKHYHLIGSVIRDEITCVGKDLSDGVAEKLSGEPTVLAPKSVKATSDSNTSDVWKSAGLFAVAASLVLVAVVTMNPLNQESEFDQVNQSGGLATSNDAIQFSDEFDEMLVEHGEFTASSGLNGLMAYAKLVSDQRLEQ